MMKFFLLLLLVATLQAHQTGLSYVNIEEDENQEIKVLYKKPLADTKSDDIKINYPSSCSKEKELPLKIENGFIINEYTLWCTESGLKDSRVWVEGLISSDRGVLIRYEKGDFIVKSLLRFSTPFIHIDYERSWYELTLEYMNLGVYHILTGYDHILFVLALLLLSHSFKSLLITISMFTLSHSITLAFGILGIVNVGVAYIEAMIALSILFLAKEMVSVKTSFTKRHLGIVAFIFGLLHGFGFSSVLREIGLPQDEIPLSLFAFNLGIELGQIVFILVVSSLFFLIKKQFHINENSMKAILAYFIGALSSYWLIDRIVGF